MARKAFSEIKVDFILLIDIYIWVYYAYLLCIYAVSIDDYIYISLGWFTATHMFVAVVILLYVPIDISLFHVYSYLCDGWGDGWFQRKKSVQLHLQNVWLHRLQFHRYKRFQNLRIQTLSLINIHSLDAQDMNGFFFFKTIKT